MPQPINVIFQTAGARELEGAFSSIAARARKLNEQVANDTAKASQRRVTAEQSAAKQITKAETELQSKILTLTKQLEKAQSDSAKRSADAQIAASKRTANQELKDFDARLKGAKKAADERAKAAKKAADDEEREIFRIAKAKTRADQQAAKEHDRISKAMQRDQRASARGVMQPISRAGRATMGTVSGVVGGLGITAGSAAIGQALWENVNLREQAALLVNATRDKSGNMTQSVSGLVGDAQGVAGKYGVGAGDVMKAMNVVSARAGGAEGLKAFKGDLEDITKTAVAFGVSMEDMGGVTAAALTAGVKPGEEMRQLIQDIAAMGKDGAIEISDLASELAKLGGAGQQTELNAGQMLRRQVGLAQIAAKAAVSKEESRTAVTDVIRDINTNAGTLKKAGVNVYGKNNLVNDPAQIIAQTMDLAMTKGINIRGQNLKGSEALNKIFTGNSAKLVNSLMGDYNAGGKEGVLAKINAASGATLAPGERDRGLATVMGGEGAQLRVNLEQFKAAIGATLPEFTKLIPTVISVTKAFAGVAQFVAKNPLAGIGALFAANLTAEVAKAGISKALESGIERLFKARAGLPGGGVGGNMSGGGKFAMGLSLAVAAVSIVAAGVSIINKSAEQGATVGKEFYAANSEAENTIRKLKAYDENEKTSQGPTLAQLMGDDAPAVLEKNNEKRAERNALLEEAASAQDRLGKARTEFGKATTPGVMDYLDPTQSAVLKKQAAEGDAAGVTPEIAKDTTAALGELMTSFRKAASDIGNTNLSNPNSPARTGKPPGM